MWSHFDAIFPVLDQSRSMHSISAGGGGGGGGAATGMGGGGGGRALPGRGGLGSSSSESSMQSCSSVSFLAAAAAVEALLWPALLSSSLGTGFQLPSLSRLMSLSSLGRSLDSMIS